ncbi:MAG: HDIG domain-containing protein [candidate division KSB1 bacterium]|nr:HDIG domain-containing protein [candidate division KSB1 bacterium]
MTRDQAYALVKPRFSNKNLFKHVLAVEAVMRELAAHFGEDVETWGVAGLLHDMDYEETADTPEKHTLVTEELLKDQDVSQEIIHAIKCHNHKAERETLMDQALYAADPVTGLIVAATLMHPEKKLASVTTDFVMRRYKEKSFARGASREQIQTCKEFGLPLDEFLSISLNGMQQISDDLGL